MDEVTQRYFFAGYYCGEMNGSFKVGSYPIIVSGDRFPAVDEVSRAIGYVLQKYHLIDVKGVIILSCQEMSKKDIKQFIPPINTFHIRI